MLVSLVDYLTKPEYTTNYVETSDWIPFSIPCIIKFLVGDALSLQEICEPFGYDERVDYESLLGKYHSIAQCVVEPGSPTIFTPPSGTMSIDQDVSPTPSTGTSNSHLGGSLESEKASKLPGTRFCEVQNSSYGYADNANLTYSHPDENSAFDSGIVTESVFNRNTTLWFVRPYDSPIFAYAQEGDIARMTSLLRNGDASVFDVDPYGLGLLYYTSYYCWRSCGSVTAMQASKVLIEMGGDAEWVDEIGKYSTPPIPYILLNIEAYLLLKYCIGNDDRRLTNF